MDAISSVKWIPPKVLVLDSLLICFVRLTCLVLIVIHVFSLHYFAKVYVILVESFRSLFLEFNNDFIEEQNFHFSVSYTDSMQ